MLRVAVLLAVASSIVWTVAGQYAPLLEDSTAILNVPGRKDVNPNGWGDSYSVGNSCYCKTNYDHSIDIIPVSTPLGNMTVKEACTLLGPGPGSKGRPMYNDVQCGHGPANDAGDETTCPGRIEHGKAGCGYIGPKWNFTGLSRTPAAPVKTPTKAPVKAPTKAPVRPPTRAPVKPPTKAPTRAPVKAPTKAPTKAPVTVTVSTPVAAPVSSKYAPLSEDNTAILNVPGRKDVNPNGWGDSYSVGNSCYCKTNYDHHIDVIPVSTPLGNMTVKEACTLLGPGPGSKGRPMYNDVQCGNGPANDAGDEDTCPGRIEYGAVGCKYIGPKWNFVGIKVPTKAPLSVPVKAPVVSPVVASTKAPTAKATAAPVTSGPTALKGCYLRELGTGKETLLTGSDWYDVNNATNPLGFSIRCDVSGLEEIVFMKFIYNGKEHDEWGEPRWLDGDSFPTPYVVPVAFLSMCGPKTVTVQGNNWSGLRFQKVYSLVAKCSGVTNGPTSNAPTTKAPTTKAPVSVPAPVKAPVSAPVASNSVSILVESSKKTGSRYQIVNSTKLTTMAVGTVAAGVSGYSADLFRFHRWAPTTFGYSISGFAAGSSYAVTLGFSETYVPNCVNGKRVFSVVANGSPLLSNFDAFAVAGCKKAYTTTHAVTATSAGKIELSFVNIRGDPFISFINVAPM